MSLVDKLRQGCVQVPKRWSGDCGEFSTVDEVKTDELMQAAADKIDVLTYALMRILTARVRVAEAEAAALRQKLEKEWQAGWNAAREEME